MIFFFRAGITGCAEINSAFSASLRETLLSLVNYKINSILKRLKFSLRSLRYSAYFASVNLGRRERKEDAKCAKFY